MSIFRGLLVLLFITTLKAEQRNAVKEPTAVDVARLKTIYLAQHLWRNISNPHFTTMARQETLESATQLISALQSLSSAINEIETPVLEDKLHYIYRWERLLAYSHGVHSLYETYNNFMRKQLESQQQASKRAWLDIAETILQDLPTAENIHRLILMAADKKEKNSTIFEMALEVSDNLEGLLASLYNIR